MFVKKRSIINLKELFNPRYRFSFSIHNKKYLMDINTVMAIDLDSSSVFSDMPRSESLMPLDESLTKFRIIINSINDDGFLSFEELKEFTNYQEMIKYIRSYKKWVN